MKEKVEWEVVDAPAQPDQADDTRPNLQQVMQAFLGRWWRWKILGVVVVMGVALAILAALAGVFVLVAALFAVGAIGLAKLRQWLTRQPASVARRGDHTGRE